MLIIHCGGLFPHSSGIQHTFCGRNVPMDSTHFLIIGIDPPSRWRRCKICDAIRKDRNKRRWPGKTARRA